MYSLKSLIIFGYLLVTNISVAQTIYGCWQIEQGDEAPAFFGEEPFDIVILQPDGDITFGLYFDPEAGLACPTEGKSKIKRYHISGKVDHSCLLRRVPRKFHFAYEYCVDHDRLTVFKFDEVFYFRRVALTE